MSGTKRATSGANDISRGQVIELAVVEREWIGILCLLLVGVRGGMVFQSSGDQFSAIRRPSASQVRSRFESPTGVSLPTASSSTT